MSQDNEYLRQAFNQFPELARIFFGQSQGSETAQAIQITIDEITKEDIPIIIAQLEQKGFDLYEIERVGNNGTDYLYNFKGYVPRNKMIDIARQQFPGLNIS